LGSDAVHVKSRFVCVIFSVMLVTVTTGLTPLQFAFGQPATAALVVSGADSTAGLVVNVVRPFLIALAGMVVVEVAGPTSTLFCPGAIFPPPFWHWYSAKPVAHGARPAPRGAAIASALGGYAPMFLLRAASGYSPSRLAWPPSQR
jgi:hypothetical protein